MRTLSGRMLGIAAMALVVAGGVAGAQGKGHGKDKDKENEKGNKHDEVVRVDAPTGNVNRVPPGLAKKPGGLPPGQYKKRYATSDGVVVLRDVFGRHGYTVDRVAPYGTSQYVYYRLPNGTVRRAVVSPGTNQLAFSNVPAALLSEVLARLR
ncbi:MAG: hypothetical protein JWN53_1837 [Gemmatimonadetes bacterium]|jgi:hypothetical protein|nr:hypothetical protein [Gemmatimonadota bacterium]